MSLGGGNIVLRVGLLLALLTSLALAGCSATLLQDKPNVRIAGSAEDYVAAKDGLRLHVDSGDKIQRALFEVDGWDLNGIIREVDEGEHVDLFGTRLAVTNEINVTHAEAPKEIQKYRYREHEKATHREAWLECVAKVRRVSESGAIAIPSLQALCIPQSERPTHVTILDG